MRIPGTLGLFALLAGQALAHPDHATQGTASLWHLATDPFHLSLVGLAAGAAFALRWALRRGAGQSRP